MEYNNGEEFKITIPLIRMIKDPAYKHKVEELIKSDIKP